MKNAYRQLTYGCAIHRQRQAELARLWATDPAAALRLHQERRERTARKRGNRIRSRYPGMGPCLDLATVFRRFTETMERAGLAAQQAATAMGAFRYEQSRARGDSQSDPAKGE